MRTGECSYSTGLVRYGFVVSTAVFAPIPQHFDVALFTPKGQFPLCIGADTCA